MNLEDRIRSYSKNSGFPSSLIVGGDGRLAGIWILGNDYRSKTKYHGAYPPNYLKRVKALFPDKKSVLHLFSGKVNLESFPGDTVDINLNLNPTFVDDGQSLMGVPVEKYDLILADPPYSGEDAEKYGFTMIKRNKVLGALSRLPQASHVCWLDQILPQWSKEIFKLVGLIGIVRSTNHRFRCLSIFERI